MKCELCKKCYYGRYICTDKGKIIGDSCELPISVHISRVSMGICDDEANGGCADFVPIDGEIPKVVVRTFDELKGGE